MVVHQQDGRITIVEVIADMLVIDLCRELVFLAGGLMIDTGSRLPAVLGLDVQVGEFPDISRRHDGSVRHLMDILVHRVETGLQGEVLQEGIAGRETELWCLIGLDDTGLITCLQQRTLCRKVIIRIIIHVTRAERIEHRITQTGRHRQLFGE